jgi:predicted AlkP superfamily pyrophosphatase or phosphodiesterase
MNYPRFLAFWGFLLLALLTSIGLPLILPQGLRSQPAAKFVLLSLDGATPHLVEEFIAQGILPADRGLGWLQQQGVSAQQFTVATPSLTAPSHIAIATGATAVQNNITANRFHLLGTPFEQTISGFAAPIGGHYLSGQEATAPTVTPLWVTLRQAGKQVVAATFPGADGAEIIEPTQKTVLQSAEVRTVDYTVPFGRGLGSATGFSLTRRDFVSAGTEVVEQLRQAGWRSLSPVLQNRMPLEELTVEEQIYSIQVAAIDTTDNSLEDYDTLVIFDSTHGISQGPFQLPATGPAYLQVNQPSQPVYLEGSPSRAGTRFFVSTFASDLSTVRLLRYAVNAIPRNAAVLADVDDINEHVGFWPPQPDFRLVQRLSPGLDSFSDQELETAYLDQVQTFVDYQTQVALRAIQQNPDADLILTYLVQPDGAGHQFLLTDPRQATNPRDATTILSGQDPAKIQRYQTYLQLAYQAADAAVQRLIAAIGTDRTGQLNRNLIVTSDHGFAPFHTAVDIEQLLKAKGLERDRVRAIPSGSAVNIYINLQGREPDGIVSRSEYVQIQQQIIETLAAAVDQNANYTRGDRRPIFNQIYPRPVPDDWNSPEFGRSTTAWIGQDSGDVFALLQTGYNFDGVQRPPVSRLGDPIANEPILSIPSFYGTHGYDATSPEMQGIFYAAGPQIGQGNIAKLRSIDIAPTLLRELAIDPNPNLQGQPIDLSKP